MTKAETYVQIPHICLQVITMTIHSVPSERAALGGLRLVINLN